MTADHPTRGKLLRDAVGTVGSTALMPITALVSGPILARVLGPDGRGAFAAVNAPLFVLVIVAAAALPDAVNQGISRRGLPVRRASNLAAGLTVAYATVVAAVAAWQAPRLFLATPEVVPLFRAVMIALPLLALEHTWRGALNGARAYRETNIERAGSLLTRLLLLVTLAVTGTLTVETAVVSNVLPSALGAVLLGWFVARRARGEQRELPVPRRQVTGSLARYSVVGAGGVLADLVNYRLDQALLVAFVDVRALGFYAVAAGLAELPSSLMGSLRQLMIAETGHRDSLEFLARVSRVITLLSVAGIAVGIVIAPWAVRLLFGAAFLDAVPLARILLAAAVPLILARIASSGLYSLGLHGRRSIAQLIAAAVTVGGLALFVPTFGITAAAWVSFAAYTLDAILVLWFLHRTPGPGALAYVVARPADVAWAWGLLRPALVSAMSRLGRSS